MPYWRPFHLFKGRERRVEGRSRDGVARAGSGSPQVPVGKPRGLVGAIFGATPASKLGPVRRC